MKVEVHRTESGVLYWRDEAFWQLDIFANHETTAADTVAFGDIVAIIARGARRPLLIYRAPGSLPSFSALQAFSRSAPALLTAVAYCVCSQDAAATSRLVAETFLASLPVEVFTGEEAAVDWIKGHLAHSTGHVAL